MNKKPKRTRASRPVPPHPVREPELQTVCGGGDDDWTSTAKTDP
jgi:hypothetical protein